MNLGGLRPRLMAGLSLVLALSFLLFGVGEYVTLRSSLVERIDTDLERTGELLAARLGQPDWQEGVDSLLRSSDPLTGLYLEVITDRQSVIYASPNLQKARLPAPERPGDFETITTQPGIQVRVYSVQTSNATVLVGQSLRALQELPLAAAGKVLLVGLITLCLSLLVTNAALGRGLAPLRRMAQTARSIVETGDVSQRVPVPQGKDDVTQVAEAFNSLVERVDHILEAQVRLLADTSHELRNPLTVIQTDIDMLGRPLDEATRQEVTEEASQEVARLIRLVQQMLLISWAEAHPVLHHEVFELDGLVRRVVGRTRGSREVGLDLPGGVWVDGDPDRIAQIVANLIENAVRYTPPEAELEVRLRQEGARARLTVRDGGPGIASPHLERIFERFYRLEPSRNRGKGGAGLGLPLARALARLHGGDLTAASVAGQGCTFEVLLPACGPPDP